MTFETGVERRGKRRNRAVVVGRTDTAGGNQVVADRQQIARGRPDPIRLVRDDTELTDLLVEFGQPLENDVDVRLANVGGQHLVADQEHTDHSTTPYRDRPTLARWGSEQRLPFEMKVPNRLTTETLAKSERGEDVHQAEDAEDLFDKLSI